MKETMHHATARPQDVDAMIEVPLYRLAHSRTGDKGNTSNISVIAYDINLYPLLRERLTEQVVRDWFGARSPTRVLRYEIASLGALNFVLDGVLDGGVNSALNLDTHGKSLSFHMLDIPVAVPREIADTLADVAAA